MKRRVRKKASRQGNLFPWLPLTMKFETLVDRAINTLFKHPVIVAAITGGKTVDICTAHRCVMIGTYKEDSSKNKEFWTTEVWGHANDARVCCYSTANVCWSHLTRGEINDILDGHDGIVRLSKPNAVKGANPEYYIMALHILNNNPYGMKAMRHFVAAR